jgi:hypothetical protein
MITEGFPGCGLGLNVAANLSSLFFLTVPLTVAEPKSFSEYAALTTTAAPPPRTFLMLLLLLLLFVREVDVVVVCNLLIDKEEEEEEEEVKLVLVEAQLVLKSDALIVPILFQRE